MTSSSLAIAAPLPPIGRPIHDARTETRIGMAIIGLFVIGLAGWASFARLDSAIHAPLSLIHI